MAASKKRCGMALVPLRGGKRLRGGDGSPGKSTIPLWKPGRLSAYAVTTSSTESKEVIIGRQDLLLCLYNACGCNPDNKTTRNRCQDCQKVNQWALSALSLEMLKFLDEGTTLQVQGSYAVVKVSKNPKEPGTTLTEIQEVAQHSNFPKRWSAKAMTAPGSRLSLNPRLGAGILEFEFVLADRSTMEINGRAVADDATKDENSSNDAKKMQISRINDGIAETYCSFSGSCPPIPLSADSSDEQDDNDGPLSQPINVLSPTESSVARPSRALGAKSDKSPTDVMKPSSIPRTASVPSSTNNLKPTSILRSRSETSTTAILKRDAPRSVSFSPQHPPPNLKSNSQMPENYRLTIYFVPRGQDLPRQRIAILAKKAERLGAVVVSEFQTATHIVISEQVTSLDPVADQLEIPVESLKRYLDARNSQLVVPKWITRAEGETLGKPSNEDFWNYYKPKLGVIHRREQRPKDRGEKGLPVSVRMVHNLELSELFRQLSKLHQSCPLIQGDHWKAYTFNKVSGRLRNLDFEIVNEPRVLAKVQSIKGMGKQVMEKIIQYLETGTIKRIIEFERDPNRVAMKAMMGIWGVGSSRASDLVLNGRYKNIDQIRKAIIDGKLAFDRNQLVGVECYEDINERMGRTEVETIGKSVEEITKKELRDAEVTVMGSYRRGKQGCGDVDVHITSKSFKKKVPRNALGKIVDALWRKGLIAFHLSFLEGMVTGKKPQDFRAASKFIPLEAWEASRHANYEYRKSGDEELTSATYFGVFNSPVVMGRRRRVDIKLYPYRERAFASLYFTGNGYFNRSMRLWARRMSYSMNDHGVFRRDFKTRRVFEATTEKEVFDKLGLMYKTPEERDCFDAVVPLEASSTVDMELNEKEFYEDKNEHVWIN